jgi:UDP-N-acetylglucosamine--N-acetylmuramyl-(pentapeptide) pyrophosphoryl-undecaprenol N-acetylglucosamine transferase
VNNPSVLLAAGGTGGHLFPAFALAQELNRRGLIVDLVTDRRGDRYGANFPARITYTVPSATIVSRSPSAALGTAWTLARGLTTALWWLGQLRPGVVVGFGGYPTLPPLLAASLRRIPTVVHEQNAVLGRANRLLARRVNTIAISFEATKGLKAAQVAKTRVTGNPVRDQVIKWGAHSYSVPAPDGPYHLLVFGGSQGARFFADAIPPALASLPAATRRSLLVVQQCRNEDLARSEEAYRASGICARLSAFFPNLPEEMARAHLVICRAGASTVAELAVIGRPAILVPLPHALDNDQLHNAIRLAESGGGWCIAQSDLAPQRLANEIERLLAEPRTLAAAAVAAKRLGRPDAVIRLADVVEEKMRRRHQAPQHVHAPSAGRDWPHKGE